MNLVRLSIFLSIISMTIILSHQIETGNETRGYRLPNNTLPLHYNISLRTNIHRGDFVFDGRVHIHVKVLEDSDTITLHYRQLAIRNVNILDVNGTIIQENVRFTMTHPLEFLDISPRIPLTINDEFIVDVSYRGILRDDGAGFIRSSYISPDTNETIWLASVQFKNTDARHAVPCYDEIKYRSTIRLQIDHHESYNAVSNTPVEEEIVVGNGFVTTIFATSPSMPTNLLTFTVSNFDFTTIVNEFNVTMSSYAQPSAVSRGETEFSLEWGQLVFRYLSNIFVTYTLPKLDQIAIPNLEWSTEPSWGLISFRESLLLHDENATPEETTARQVRIAHVFTHNYFGNLVSPVWWTFLWMNEGFATLYEKIIVDNINGPPYTQYNQFMLVTKDEVMFADVNGALVPLNHYPESPKEINDKAYDVIVTHYKAAFIIYMARAMMHPVTFERGIVDYLNVRAFNSVTPDDLHAALQRAYNEDNPGSAVDIASIMWSWENLSGYPVVTASIAGDRLSFTQEGFNTPHDELYGIPIAIATASSPNFSYPLQHIYWMNDKEFEFSLSNSTIDWTENDWIVVNARNFAYFITNYDDTLWNLLIEALTGNERERISFENRGTLFSNFYLFIEHAYDVSSTIFLRLAQSLRLENETSVWNRANRGLLRFTNRLRATQLFDNHLNFLTNLFVPIYDRLLNDGDFNSELTDLVSFWSCTSGIQACLDAAAERLFDTNDESSMCPGFMTANSTVLAQFWNEALLNETSRDQLLTDLACSNDRSFLSVYLNASLDMTNGFLRDQREAIINRVFSANFVGFDLIGDFYLNNHFFIHSEIMDVGEYLANIATFVNTDTEAELILGLVAFIPPTSAVSGHQIESLIATNLRWYRRNFDELEEFYNDQ